MKFCLTQVHVLYSWFILELWGDLWFSSSIGSKSLYIHYINDTYCMFFFSKLWSYAPSLFLRTSQLLSRTSLALQILSNNGNSDSCVPAQPSRKTSSTRPDGFWKEQLKTCWALGWSVLKWRQKGNNCSWSEWCSCGTRACAGARMDADWRQAIGPWNPGKPCAVCVLILESIQWFSWRSAV